MAPIDLSLRKRWFVHGKTFYRLLEFLSAIFARCHWIAAELCAELARKGQRLHFTQVYHPHVPYRPLPSSNNPNPNMKAAYKNALEASAGASGIQVVQDEIDLTLLRFEFEPGEVSWVAFNPNGESVKVGNVESTELMRYQKDS